jgi:hypothetical protein
MIKLIKRLFDLRNTCCPRDDGKPEYTPWQRKEKEYERPRLDSDSVYDETVTIIVKVVIWQERQCATCGKIEQESLRY